jgi:hypothetical protein
MTLYRDSAAVLGLVSRPAVDLNGEGAPSAYCGYHVVAKHGESEPL